MRTLGSVTQTDADVAWLTPEERAAWLGAAALMLRLPGALDAQLMRESGLRFYEYMVLVGLSEAPDRTLPMSDLAEWSSSSLSRLSHAASRLETQGLITRHRVPGPGRRTVATLTDSGYAAVSAAAPGHVARVRTLLIDHLSADDLAALARAGRAVMDALGEGACSEL